MHHEHLLPLDVRAGSPSPYWSDIKSSGSTRPAESLLNFSGFFRRTAAGAEPDIAFVEMSAFFEDLRVAGCL